MDKIYKSCEGLKRGELFDSKILGYRIIILALSYKVCVSDTGFRTSLHVCDFYRIWTSAKIIQIYSVDEMSHVCWELTRFFVDITMSIEEAKPMYKRNHKSHLLTALQEQTVAQFHDISLVYACHLLPLILGGIVERKFGNSGRFLSRDNLQALHHTGNRFMFQCRVFAFSLFTNDDGIDVMMTTLHAWQTSDVHNICIQIQFSSQFHVQCLQFTGATEIGCCQNSLEDVNLIIETSDGRCIIALLSWRNVKQTSEAQPIKKTFDCCLVTSHLTLRQTLFFLMDAVTSSNLALMVGLTSEKKNVSKSTGQLAALNTSCSEYISSGPTPSPGINVHVVRLSGFDSPLRNSSDKI